MSNRNAVIIKKVKKVSGAGHHGGAWKVAYADFVTAMMAFFLLLWLLSMVSEEKRARVSEYYKNFSLYSESGSTFIGGAESDKFSKSGGGDEKVLTELEGENKDVNDVQENLNKAISDNLGDLEEQVLIEKVSEGIRIHLTDNEGSTMFHSGSAEMTAKAKEVLRVIGENIKSLKNRVSIEGHTDAVPFAGKNYSNWELSTERASSARKELEINGLNPKRLVSVAGFADTDPLVKDDPHDSRNRRISIILKFPKKEQKKTLLTKKPLNPEKKLSEEILNIIDKTSITARGKSDKDAINIVVDPPDNKPASSPPSLEEVKEWKTVTAPSDPSEQKDSPDSSQKNDKFSPVLNKKGWKPIF